MTDRYASLKQGLVGCWIPSVSGSGLLLPDLSGRGNNGSLVNMDASDWVSSGSGRALDFDGVDDTVIANLSPAITLGKNATVSAWAKTTTTSGNQPVFTVGGRFTGFINLTLRGIPPLSAIFELWDLTNNPNIIVSVNANQWYHLAGVFQEGVMTFYIDGNVAGTLNNATTQATNIPSQIVARIGNNTDYNLWLTGQADDARVYNRALSASEIRLLSSEPGIGFKPAKKLSRFSQRFTYKPAKPRNYSVIRNRDPNYSTLRQGLVAAYCPSISGQGNVLPDLVGGNHGTLTNMTADDWVSSGDGRALDFDGVDDYVDAGDCCDFTSGFMTISAWIKRNETTTAQRTVVSKFDRTSGVASEDGFGFGVINNTISYAATLDGATHRFSATVADLNVTDWVHIAVKVETNNGSAAALYKNGLQVTASWVTLTGNVTLDNNTYSLRLGNYRYSGVNYDHFSGLVDDVRIYNRALTESEIKLLASKRGIGLRQESHRNTFYQFPSGSRRKRILTGMP